MACLQIALHTLGAKHSPIDRKVFPWLEAGHLVIFDFELNSTLHTTETAMGFHQTVWLLARSPASGRHVVEMGTISLDQFRNWLWYVSHWISSPAPRRKSPATPNPCQRFAREPTRCRRSSSRLGFWRSPV